MKVRVNLYGTLRRGFPDYQHSQGIEVELPEGAPVKDLLALLEISESKGAVVIADGYVLEPDSELKRGVPVTICQAVRGG